jgi:hypothetical protein
MRWFNKTASHTSLSGVTRSKLEMNGLELVDVDEEEPVSNGLGKYAGGGGGREI